MLGWLRAHDPNWYTLRRSLRAAVVVPVNFAVGSQLIGNAQVATFAAFGSFAMLIFVNFPGGRVARTGSYLVLAAAGAVLIALGTLVATPDWLAVVAMGVVAFGVLFSGVVSSTLNAGTQAALLAFILAVMLPGVRGDLPERLAGWGLAAALAIPVAVLVWPPDDQNVLRMKAAAVCRALAAMLHLEQPPPGAGDPLVALSRSAGQLRQAFRTSAARAVALSTGARLVVRLADELEWLTTAVINACADAPEGWPEQGRRLRDAASRVLAAAADTLDHNGDGPALTACGTLEDCVAALEEARKAVADETLAELRASTKVRDAVTTAGEFDRPLYAAHELGYTVALSARTVSAIAAADSRRWWARLVGRQPAAVGELGATAIAQRVASGHLDRHSVWLQNSIRGAVGLAFAVLLARLVDAQNAFWIGLGALSVLRTNALATGATVVRALAGTVIGFAIGGAAVAVIGTNHAVLWTLLPLVIMVAASSPIVISFIAGQAAFTVFTIMLFNIIAPAGWRIGVFRVEDVALGCLASLVAGFLFWPRGAGAALGAAYADAYRASAGYLRQSIQRLTGTPVSAPDAAPIASAAGTRLDDALRQYLADKGAKNVPLESVAALANGATRLRLAGMAISSLRPDAPDGRAGDGLLAAPVAVLSRRTDEVASWYGALADGFVGSAGELPAVDSSDDSFLDVVLPAVDSCGDPGRAARAERLLWSGQYLGDVNRLRGELLEPAAQVRAAQARPWWRR
ncbi:MAG TPA: FUSC family protein [Jatrophihabitantaceae bacterium]|nr:FUSC family protein [Jatrophihabitantaceae bacterium]